MIGNVHTIQSAAKRYMMDNSRAPNTLLISRDARDALVRECLYIHDTTACSRFLGMRIVIADIPYFEIAYSAGTCDRRLKDRRISRV